MRALTEIEAIKIKKTGGTSSQFLKADGSIDNTEYISEHQDISGKLNVDGSNATKIGTNAQLNTLDAGDSTPNDATNVITENVNNDGTYTKRPLSFIWNYIKGKTDTLYANKNFIRLRYPYNPTPKQETERMFTTFLTNEIHIPNKGFVSGIFLTYGTDNNKVWQLFARCEPKATLNNSKDRLWFRCGVGDTWGDIREVILDDRIAEADKSGLIKLGYTQNEKNYPITVDSNGKAYVNVPWTDTDTKYNAATQSDEGLMSAADKKKLDGIEAGAIKYTLPLATNSVLGGVKLGNSVTAVSGILRVDYDNVAPVLVYKMRQYSILKLVIKRPFDNFSFKVTVSTNDALSNYSFEFSGEYPNAVWGHYICRLTNNNANIQKYIWLDSMAMYIPAIVGAKILISDFVATNYDLNDYSTLQIDFFDCEETSTPNGNQIPLESPIMQHQSLNTINGLSLPGTGNIDINPSHSYLGSCETAASTKDKVVTIGNFPTTLTKGLEVVVNFTNTNSASVASLTLNVSGTGAKLIKIRKNNTINNLPSTSYLNSSYPVKFIFDGTYWVAINIEIDNNTTYDLSSYITNTTFNQATDIITGVIPVSNPTEIIPDLATNIVLPDNSTAIEFITRQQITNFLTQNQKIPYYTLDIGLYDFSSDSGRGFNSTITAIKNIGYDVFIENDINEMIQNGMVVLIKLIVTNARVEQRRVVVECYRRV